MASLFKPTYTVPLPDGAEVVTRKDHRGKQRPFVRLQEKGKAVFYPLTKKGDGYLVPVAKWYGKYTDHQGQVQRVPLSENKAVAQQMLAELVRAAEMGKVGLANPFAEHRRRPLAEHLADFEASLRARGTGDESIALKTARLRAILEGCRFALIGDLAADRLELFLAGLRAAPPEGKGLSVQTSNDYLQAAKQFVRWLVDNDRTDRNPFARLKRGNVELDPRHPRRALPPEELTAVLQAALMSLRTFRGLAGRDRHFLYLAAMTTGFRAGELASLLPASFALEAEPPVVVLPAREDKAGRPVTQPLPPELAAALRDYLAGRPADRPVWPGTWADRSADMLKIDLEAAGIPYTVEGPDGPLYADFHALRHSYIALLDRAGLTLKQAMQLARHSDPKLTMRRYGRAQLRDLAEAVGRLPSVLSTCPILVPERDGGVGSVRESEEGGPERGRAQTVAEGPAPEGIEGEREQLTGESGEGGIRTRGRGLSPYAALAKRCYRPLSHLSTRPSAGPAGAPKAV